VALSVRLQSNRLPALAAAQRTAVAAAVRATLFAVEAGAKQRAAVDTGAMRAGIFTEADADGLGGQVGVPAAYALHQEYGTSRMPAAPFLTPAAEAQRAPFARRVARALAGATG
jgi:HK97 gp10 family phage protein